MPTYPTAASFNLGATKLPTLGYMTTIAKGKSTETLFDAVKVGKVDKNFDITIYQEAVYSGGYKAGDTVELDIIKAAFDAVEDSSN